MGIASCLPLGMGSRETRLTYAQHAELIVVHMLNVESTHNVGYCLLVLAQFTQSRLSTGTLGDVGAQSSACAGMVDGAPQPLAAHLCPRGMWHFSCSIQPKIIVNPSARRKHAL